MKKLWTIWLIGLLLPEVAGAQTVRANVANVFDPRSVFLSSSALAFQRGMQVTVGYERYHQGIPGDALRNGFAAFSLPFGALGTAGITAQYFSSSIYQQGNFNLCYGYPLFDKRLGLGLDIGLLNLSYDRENFHLEDPDDPVFRQGMSKNTFDLGASVLTNPVHFLYVGAAAKHLNRPNVSLVQDVTRLSPTFDLGMMFSHPVARPFLSVEYSESKFRTSIGLEGWFQKRHAMLRANWGRFHYDLGAGYLIDLPGSWVRLDYEYEYPLSDLSKISNGTHQFLVTYGFLPREGDFDLEVEPVRLSVYAGDQASFVVKARRHGDFPRRIKLQAIGSDPRIFSSLFPVSLSDHETSTLALTTSLRCQPGDYHIEVHGWTDEGKKEKHAAVLLEVKRRNRLAGEVLATIDTLIIQETRRELSRNPLLPYIFFNENEIVLPSGRYEILNPEQYPTNKFMFFLETLTDISSQYKNTLNVLARRLRESPEMKIKICGYNSGWGIEEGNLKLSHGRAETVQNYLVRNCGARAEQVIVETGQMPPDPASNSDPLGREENRRVEIVPFPGSEKILDPIITESTDISTSDGICTFQIKNLIAEAGLQRWEMPILEAPNDTFKVFRGEKSPEELLAWDWKNETGRSVQVGKDYLYCLTLWDSLDNRFTSDWKRIHVKKVSESEEAYVEKNIEKTRLILFKYDRANMELTPFMQKELDEIAEKLQADTGASLLIHGHTCIMGSPEYNLGLSSRRAQTVAEYFSKNHISQSRIFSAGFGLTKPLLDNALPEGRMINRRVELSVSYLVEKTIHWKI